MGEAGFAFRDGLVCAVARLSSEIDFDHARCARDRVSVEV
jgi:hypothetical protein